MKYFGKVCKDVISEFQGIAIGLARHVSGCTNLLIAPKVKNGKFKTALYFSIDRIEILGDGIKVDEAKSDETVDAPELGRYGRDKFSKLEGWVVAKIVSLYGSNSLALQPIAKNGEYKGVQVLDEVRIEFIEGETVSLGEVQSAKPGGFDIPVPDNRNF